MSDWCTLPFSWSHVIYIKLSDCILGWIDYHRQVHLQLIRPSLFSLVFQVPLPMPEMRILNARIIRKPITATKLCTCAQSLIVTERIFGNSIRGDSYHHATPGSNKKMQDNHAGRKRHLLMLYSREAGALIKLRWHETAVTYRLPLHNVGDLGIPLIHPCYYWAWTAWT